MCFYLAAEGDALIQASVLIALVSIGNLSVFTAFLAAQLFVSRPIEATPVSLLFVTIA